MESLRDKSCWMVREKVIADYLQVCKEAVEDDSVFNTFRSDPRYTAILEHTTKKVGWKYYESIEKKNPHLLDLPRFLENDFFGSPQKEVFGSICCSPSTLQYIGVLSNLIHEFGDITDFKIIEIGGGYGGQCSVINNFFNIFSYDIIDLPEVSDLQEKFLTKLGCIDNVDCFSNINKVETNYDLVISNYCLTEILEPLQTEYVERVLLNSKHGYITCNGKINAINKLKEKFPKLKFSSDIEGESLENYIITW